MSTTEKSKIEIQEIINQMRRLTTAQVRKQLTQDQKRYPGRLAVIWGFFKDAKEQMK
jgi:hypothetical protein